MRVTVLSAILLALMLACPVSRAQNMYGGNPADPDLLESGFSNPALNAYVNDRVAFALTTHHVGVAGGFLGIKSGFITYHLPWVTRGGCVGLQFLRAGLYSQNSVRLSYGRIVIAPLSIGMNLDVFSRSFDRSKFFMFDDRDPVFRDGDSKMGFSIGLGLAFRAHRSLAIGVNIEHLNRPDLAMGPTPFHQPLMVSAGIKWMGRGVNGLSMFNPFRVDNYSAPALADAAERIPYAAQAGFEVSFERASLRTALDAANAQLEVEAPLYGSLFFNYRYSYPVSAIRVASDGSHRFGFFVHPDRMPILSSYPVMPALPKVETAIVPLPAAPRGLIFVCANTDSMSKMRLKIRRSIEEGIRPQNLSLLFPEDLGDLRASLNPTKLTEIDLLDARDPTLKLEGLYSPRYRGAVEGIGLLMTQVKPPPRAEFLTYPGAERRANALVNLLTGDRITVKSHVPLYTANSRPLTVERLQQMTEVAEETQELLYPENITFYFEPIFRSITNCQWWLEVRNAAEEVAFSFYGRDQLPDSLTWNWRDKDGNVIPPGIYTYLLRMVDRQGRTDFSHRGQIRVTFQHRSLAIDITRKPRVGDANADRYTLIVGPHGAPTVKKTDSPSNP